MTATALAMPPDDDPPATSWPEFTWPAWIPARVRIGIEHNFPAGPATWFAAGRQFSAPELGSGLRLSTPDGPVRGRYVHYGASPVGRLVHHAGDLPRTSVTAMVAGRVEWIGHPKR